MSDNKRLIMGMGLIAAAFYLSRGRGYAATPQYTQQVGQGVPRGALGAGSMPGSVGSGLAQQIGGVIGNAIVKQFGGGTAFGIPPTNSVYNMFPPMAGDGVLQNDIQAADPSATFDPGFNLGLETGYEGWA